MMQKKLNLFSFLIIICMTVASSSSYSQEGSLSPGYNLLKAVKDGDYSKVRTHLQRGTNVNTRDYNDGETPLYLATQNRDATMVTFLLDGKAKPDIGTKTTGETPLMVAVRLRLPKIIEMLISQNADPNIGDRNGETALYKAVRANDREAVKMLLEADADWSMTDNTGRTPLDLAKENRRLRSMIKLLEDVGAEY